MEVLTTHSQQLRSGNSSKRIWWEGYKQQAVPRQPTRPLFTVSDNKEKTEGKEKKKNRGNTSKHIKKMLFWQPN